MGSEGGGGETGCFQESSLYPSVLWLSLIPSAVCLMLPSRNSLQRFSPTVLEAAGWAKEGNKRLAPRRGGAAEPSAGSELQASAFK